MSTTPTDRGYVVVRQRADGTKKVIICAAVAEGEPVSPFAIHYQCRSLRVQPGIQMVHAGSTRHTNEVVEVFAEEPGIVHIRALRGDAHPALREDARTA